MHTYAYHEDRSPIQCLTLMCSVKMFLCKTLVSVYLVNVEFLEGLKEANSNSNACVISKLVDVKAWMQPQMNEIHNHTNPHVFRFVKGSDSRCYMQYKHWNHNEWEPQDSPGIQLLKCVLGVLVAPTYL